MSIPTTPPNGAVPPQNPQYPGQPYVQPTYVVMKPQRNMLVFVAGILMIIFGAIDIIVAFGEFAATSITSSVDSVLGTSSTGILVFSAIMTLISGAALLVVGILGCINAGKLEKANFLFIAGVVLVILTLITFIIGIVAFGFSIFSLIGFVLPILFVVGANQMKQQAAAAGIAQA